MMLFIKCLYKLLDWSSRRLCKWTGPYIKRASRNDTTRRLLRHVDLYFPPNSQFSYAQVSMTCTQTFVLREISVDSDTKNCSRSVFALH
jgi:hypothetical protein